ncbi:MAG: hypothetical protein AABZ32_09290 [Bacteroidota bacterium]
MKKQIILLAAVLFLIPYTLYLIPLCSAQSAGKEQAVPYTLEDRDRTVRMEVQMNERFESVNDKFEYQQQQINDLKTLFYWGFGIMIGFMMFLLGFIIWDRRTAMEPIREHTQSLMQTLRDYAKEQPKLADILRSHGIL